MITRVETNLGGGLQPRHGWVFSARAADQKRRGTLCASYIARGSTLGLSPRMRTYQPAAYNPLKMNTYTKRGGVAHLRHAFRFETLA